MYFAAAGDSPETIAFKRSMRESYQNVLGATLQGDISAEPPTPLTYAVEAYYAGQEAQSSNLDAHGATQPEPGQEATGLSPDILEALSIAESIGTPNGATDEQIVRSYRAGLNRQERRRFDRLTPEQKSAEALQ